MPDTAPTATANRSTPSRWQFSLRALFGLTAIVAGLLAIGLAGLWYFVVQLLVIAIVGLGFFIGRRYALRTGVEKSGFLGLMAAISLAFALFGLWFHRDTLVNATLPLGAGLAAAVGYGAAQAANNSVRSVSGHVISRYLYAFIAVALVTGWGTLHVLENRYKAQVRRHTGTIENRTLSWSWGKLAYRTIGSVRLYQFWTLDVHDWGGRATDADLEVIASVDLVNSIDVARSQITDAGLAHLKSLQNLQSLDVRGTKVTARAIDELRQSLPNLTDVKR